MDFTIEQMEYLLQSKGWTYVDGYDIDYDGVDENQRRVMTRKELELILASPPSRMWWDEGREVYVDVDSAFDSLIDDYNLRDGRDMSIVEIEIELMQKYQEAKSGEKK